MLIEFDLYPISNVFREGHQIRLTLNFADQRATPRLGPAPEVTLAGIRLGQLPGALVRHLDSAAVHAESTATRHTIQSTPDGNTAVVMRKQFWTRSFP